MVVRGGAGLFLLLLFVLGAGALFDVAPLPAGTGSLPCSVGHLYPSSPCLSAVLSLKPRRTQGSGFWPRRPGRLTGVFADRGGGTALRYRAQPAGAPAVGRWFPVRRGSRYTT